MKYILVFSFFISLPSFAQYYPRGVNINDGYLPNLDEPDKWIFSVDGIVDWQKESSDTSEASYQLIRSHFNFFYGGQIFRGGFRAIYDFNRDVKDLSLGLGFTYNRPLFFEAGLGHLTRQSSNISVTGISYNAKVGYYFGWIMHIQYRLRIRMSLAFDYKTISSGANQTVLQVYPLLGLEFET